MKYAQLKCKYLHIFSPERSRSQREPDPRVQGGGHPEVLLRPPPLRYIQGRLGLADLAGHLLRSHNCSLQRLLHGGGDTRRRRLLGPQPPKCQRYFGGDTFHHW